MLIDFTDEELEMIYDLVYDHEAEIGYTIFYGSDQSNTEHSEIANSILNKMTEEGFTRFQYGKRNKN